MILIVGCNDPYQQQEEWFSKIIEKIIKQSSLEYDRIEVEYNKDSTSLL